MMSSILGGFSLTTSAMTMAISVSTREGTAGAAPLTIAL